MGRSHSINDNKDNIVKKNTVIPENNGIVRRHYSNTKDVFDVVTKQIILPDTYQFTNLVKWVCLHCTLAESYAHWTISSPNLILKVIFLFQSFLIITVVNK